HDALLGIERLAQITPDDRREVLPVLLVERIVQPELLAQPLDVGGRGARLVEHQLRRVAGQDAHQAEDDRGDPEEDRNAGENPKADEAQHTESPSRLLDQGPRLKEGEATVPRTPSLFRPSSLVRRLSAFDPDVVEPGINALDVVRDVLDRGG